MTRKLLVLTIIVYRIHILKSCFSYDDYEEPLKKGNAYERNEKDPWNGWTPSNKTKRMWRDWMREYNKNYLNVDKDYDKAVHGKMPERGPNSGWPDDWRGLGTGNAGVNPPPWAYVPRPLGKPSVCLHRPVKGPCNQTLIRWGFNPFTNKCENYTYSGCKGSQNNFILKEKCQELCMQPISSGCDTDLQYLDNIPASGPN